IAGVAGAEVDPPVPRSEDQRCRRLRMARPPRVTGGRPGNHHPSTGPAPRQAHSSLYSRELSKSLTGGISAATTVPSGRLRVTVRPFRIAQRGLRVTPCATPARPARWHSLPTTAEPPIPTYVEMNTWSPTRE